MHFLHRIARVTTSEEGLPSSTAFRVLASAPGADLSGGRRGQFMGPAGTADRCMLNWTTSSPLSSFHDLAPRAPVVVSKVSKARFLGPVQYASDVKALLTGVRRWLAARRLPGAHIR